MYYYFYYFMRHIEAVMFLPLFYSVYILSVDASSLLFSVPSYDFHPKELGLVQTLEVQRSSMSRKISLQPSSLPGFPMVILTPDTQSTQLSCAEQSWAASIEVGWASEKLGTPPMGVLLHWMALVMHSCFLPFSCQDYTIFFFRKRLLHQESNSRNPPVLDSREWIKKVKGDEKEQEEEMWVLERVGRCAEGE